MGILCMERGYQSRLHLIQFFLVKYFDQTLANSAALLQELFPGKFKPTPAHYFMTLLHQKGLLLRCFTQNIDSLEREAHLPREKVVAAHGTLLPSRPFFDRIAMFTYADASLHSNV